MNQKRKKNVSKKQRKTVSMTMDPLSSHLSLIGEKASSLRPCDDGSFQIDSFLDLFSILIDIYPILFPRPVSYFLRRDVENGVSVVKREGSKEGATTLRQLVDRQTERLGPSGCEALTENGTKSLLWLQRTGMFLVEMMERVGKGPSVAASEAYDLVLRPFHSFSTRALAGTVLSYSPSFEGADPSLLIEVASSLRPIAERVGALLDEKGAVFAERL